MATKEETLVEWLRDAYAMEKQAIDLIENQLKRLQNYPEFQARLREHLEETRQQADIVKQCLSRYGADVSTFKDMATRFMGNMQSMMTSMAQDEVVKYCIANYSFESFEIASYRCNIAAAEDVGDMQTKRDLETILAQEQRMQAWLEDHTPEITRAYLRAQTEHAPSEVKR